MNKNICLSLVAILTVLCFVNGCNRNCDNFATADGKALDAKLLEQLAGRWVGDRDGWQFMIEPNGVIGAFTHTIGRIVVIPGRINTYPLIENGTGYIDPGTVALTFDDNSHDLSIEVELKKFKWQKGNQIVEGNSIDVFSGKVSEDFTTWTANWQSIPSYCVSTPDVSHKVLPIEESSYDQGTIVFTREKR